MVIQAFPFWGLGMMSIVIQTFPLWAENEIMPCGFAAPDVLDNAPSSAHQLNEEGRLAGIELPSRNEDDGHPSLSLLGPGHHEHCDSNLSLVGGDDELELEPAFPRVSSLLDSGLTESSSLIDGS